jgi:hypothetical protein
MIKKFILSISLLFTVASIAQEGTASPYSFYGIGDVRFKGTVENRLMGGISMLSDSIHINLQNPASFAGLKLTTFTVAGTFKTYDFVTYNDKEKAQRTTLDYLAVAVPIGKKFGASFGLIPYSSVGYKVSNTSTNNLGIQQVKTNVASGGLNKVYVALGYKVTKDLSVGADFNFNFGTIESESYLLPNVELGILQLNNSELNGLNLNLGAMYQKKITAKLDVYSSFVYSPESNLRVSNSVTTSSISSSGASFQTEDERISERDIKLPSKISFGLGIGQTRKWLIGAEITSVESSKSSNLFPTYTLGTFENSMKYSLGGYFLPNYNSFTNYFNKVTYRGGFRYENTGLVISNESIKEQAFSLGFGFPLGGTFSNLNIGAELGKRGTAKANLVQENFFNVMISLSVNDLWFVKRKYD